MTHSKFSGPKISAVIPVHNGAAFVGRAVDSVLLQRYPSVEVIVVNDGSTDGTGEALRRYEAEQNLQIISNAQNRGRSYSRNRGAKAASGEIIAFLDADDEWGTGHATRLAELHSGAAHPDVVYITPDFIDKNGKTIGRQKLDIKRYGPAELILQGAMPYTSGLSFSRRAWQVLPGFDQRLDEREDWRLAIDCVVWGASIAIASTHTIRVRRHGANHSRNLARFAAATERVALTAVQAASVLEPGRRALLESKIRVHAALVMMAAGEKRKGVDYLLAAVRNSWKVLATPAPLQVLIRLARGFAGNLI